jgi:hypothetical protein
MKFPWIQSVRDTNKLTVFNGINAGHWVNVFSFALHTFNKISGLKMQMVPSKDEDSANVVMKLSEGNATYPWGGNSDPIVFVGTAAHGKTRLFRNESDEVIKAVTFLPAKPADDHIHVLQHIAIHELVHACGIDNGAKNEEHDSDGVFITLPNIANGKTYSTPATKKMPPFFFGSKTKTSLSTYWS